MSDSSCDLKNRAHRAMVEAGFHPDFEPALRAELASLDGKLPSSVDPAIRDLRGLLWSSIDNSTSRDLDQIEFAERLPDGTIKLLIGIADVDSRVPRGSATDQHAASETTSVYTGITTFPMLPEEL